MRPAAIIIVGMGLAAFAGCTGAPPQIPLTQTPDTLMDVLKHGSFIWSTNHTWDGVGAIRLEAWGIGFGNPCELEYAFAGRSGGEPHYYLYIIGDGSRIYQSMMHGSGFKASIAGYGTPQAYQAIEPVSSVLFPGDAYAKRGIVPADYFAKKWADHLSIVIIGHGFAPLPSGPPIGSFPEHLGNDSIRLRLDCRNPVQHELYASREALLVSQNEFDSAPVSIDLGGVAATTRNASLERDFSSETWVLAHSCIMDPDDEEDPIGSLKIDHPSGSNEWDFRGVTSDLIKDTAGRYRFDLDFTAVPKGTRCLNRESLVVSAAAWVPWAGFA